MTRFAGSVRQHEGNSRSQKDPWPYVRALTLFMLIYGSLFPSVGGVDPVLIGLIVAIPLVLWEVLRCLPRSLPIGAILAIGVVALLAIHPILSPPEGAYGHDKFVRLLTLTLGTMLSAMLLRDTRGVRVFAHVWLVAGFVLALSTLGGQEVGTRAVGLDENSGPIGIARALTIALIIVIWMRWESRLRSPIAVVLSALLIFGIFATGSRGPLLAAVVATLVLAFSKNRAGGRLYFFSVVTLAAVAAVLFVPSIRDSRVGRFFVNPTSDLSTTSRIDLWRAAVDLITSQPNGVGMGNFQFVTGAHALWPHNVFLEVLAESGWIIGALFIVVVARVFVRLVQARSTSPEARLILSVLVAELLFVMSSGDLSTARTFLAVVVIAHMIATLSHGGGRTAPPGPSRSLEWRTASGALPPPNSSRASP